MACTSSTSFAGGRLSLSKSIVITLPTFELIVRRGISRYDAARGWEPYSGSSSSILAFIFWIRLLYASTAFEYATFSQMVIVICSTATLKTNFHERMIRAIAMRATVTLMPDTMQSMRLRRVISVFELRSSMCFSNGVRSRLFIFFMFPTSGLTVSGKTCEARLFRVRVQASCWRCHRFVSVMSSDTTIHLLSFSSRSRRCTAPSCA